MLRRCVLFVAVLGLIVPQTGNAYTPTSPERYAHGGLNGVRNYTGRSPLSLSTTMSACAHRHSARMAASGKLYHSGCSSKRENIGYAGSLDKILHLWLASSAHRANILCGCTRIAVGVYKTSTLYWLTEIYW
jgi:uncharacterized protein YkwD